MAEWTATDQAYFTDFITKNFVNFVTGLRADDVVMDITPLLGRQNDIASMKPKDANKILRQFISEEAVKIFSARFRAEKYRKRKRKKTVQLQEDTHKKLLALKDLLNADTVDEVLDYALSKKYDNDYEFIDAKGTLGETEFDPDVFSLPGFMLRLTKDDRNKLMVMLTRIYEDAWNTAKTSRSRNKDIVNESMMMSKYLGALFDNKQLQR